MKKLNKALSVFLLVMLFAMFSFGSACKKDEEPASESNSVSDSSSLRITPRFRKSL